MQVKLARFTQRQLVAQNVSVSRQKQRLST